MNIPSRLPLTTSLQLLQNDYVLCYTLPGICNNKHENIYVPIPFYIFTLLHRALFALPQIICKKSLHYYIAV